MLDREECERLLSIAWDVEGLLSDDVVLLEKCDGPSRVNGSALADWIEARTLSEEDKMILDAALWDMRDRMESISGDISSARACEALRDRLLGGPDGNA